MNIVVIVSGFRSVGVTVPWEALSMQVPAANLQHYTDKALESQKTYIP